MNGHAKFGLAIVAAATLIGPLYAQPSVPASSAAAKTEAAAPDVNEMVCEKLQMIGSRLATKKVCMTRSQWADSRRQDREAVEKAQASPCVLTHNGGGGRPSC